MRRTHTLEFRLGCLLLIELFLGFPALVVDDLLLGLMCRHSAANRVGEFGFEQYDELVSHLRLAFGAEDIPESKKPPWKVFEDGDTFAHLRLCRRIEAADARF